MFRYFFLSLKDKYVQIINEIAFHSHTGVDVRILQFMIQISKINYELKSQKTVWIAGWTGYGYWLCDAGKLWIAWLDQIKNKYSQRDD